MILSIETSSPEAGVAVVEDTPSGGLVVRSLRQARVTTHSEELLPLIRDALDEAGGKPIDLTTIACGAGPGSFTGLRIGLATAKGLCFALDRPLVTVSSLASLASRAPGGGIAVACLDAYKGEVYAGFFRAGDPPLLEGDEMAIAPDQLAELIASRGARTDEGPIHVIGDASLRWPVLRVPGAIVDDVRGPGPVEIARLALHRVRRQQWDDLALIAPQYIRPSAAEIAWRNRAR